MTFPRFRRNLRPVGVLLVALALGACAEDAPQDTLDPAGPLAEKIDTLFNWVMLPAVIVFVLVQSLVIYAVVKFRRRPGDDEWPEQTHGNTRLEIGWTIIPALILVTVALFTVPVILELNEKSPADALRVQVTGQQFWWAYEYPDEGGFATANELHIPAGERIYLELESKDVIHSFWTPRLNGKRDVVPGRTHTWIIEADEPGVYSGQCAEFCGDSHANMRLKVVAHDQAGYDQWIEDQQALPEEPTDGLEATGFKLFGQRCASCHAVGGQYDEVLAESPPAPDLTHLFSRDCFAGCLYDLNDRNEVEAWLRNPQRKAGSKMVIPELGEDEIDALYAYLKTLQ